MVYHETLLTLRNLHSIGIICPVG